MTDGTFIDRLAAEMASPRILAIPPDDGLDDLSVLVLPDGYSGYAVDPESLRPAPRRPAGAVGLATFDDLVEYTTWVVDDAGGALKAVAYLAPDELRVVFNGDTGAGPGWGDWYARTSLKPSRDWVAWTRGGMLDQTAFADFLEDHLSNIADPPAAGLIEIARHFRLHTDVTWERAVNASSGAVQFTYKEADRPTSVEVPARLKLYLPALESPPAAVANGVELDARLRWSRPSAEKGITFRWEVDAGAVAAAVDKVQRDLAAAFAAGAALPTFVVASIPTPRPWAPPVYTRIPQS